jgi:hypothetical protein
MKRYRFILLLALCSFTVQVDAQPFWGIGPFQNLQGYFKAFHNGTIRQLEYLPVKNYKLGDNILGFIDNKGDVKVFTGEKVITLAGIANSYEVSDNIMAFTQGPILSAWSNGQGMKLTNFGRRYLVTDSLVVFEDTQFNTVKVWYNYEVKDLYTVVGDVSMPSAIGDNLVAFKGVGNTYYIFHRGRFHELMTYSYGIKFDCGRDIAAFNDPVHMSFAIYENGQFLDLDPMHAKEFKAGISCVTYLDQNRNLQYYSKGNLKTLSNYSPDYWDARDHIVLWGEGDLFQVWDGKRLVTAGYFRPNRWVIKNNVVAFFNQMGGVDCVIEGEVINITNEPAVDFYINGSMVVVELPNSSFLAYAGGKKIRSL